MLPPADRLVGAQLHRYIRDKLYWVLHAPRQTGKTTFLQSWAREINAGNEASACYVSIERCQRMPELERCMPDLCKAIQDYAASSNMPVPELKASTPGSMLSDVLINFSALVAPKPLVMPFDETDALEGDSLISFLRQLRSGFMMRDIGKFPTSIALVGMRDLRDYITAAKDGIPPSSLSPFNIKEDSIFISNFSRDDAAALFAQRTNETGQKISAEALDYVYKQSWGQPWIVNSLFKRATMQVLKEDSKEAVTIDHIFAAQEQMIQARETHLDTLSVRLRDPKIRYVIETIITGDSDPRFSPSNPDVELAIDLGLIKWESATGFKISNPIYEDILTRHLNAGYHSNLPPPSEWKWQKADGSLDMDSLLREFQNFWRNHSEVWEEKSDYTEAFPHLLLTAFFQRLLNGGGRVDREVAAGRGRMDLRIEYMGEKFIVELKLIRRRDSPERVREEGLRQIASYRDKAAPGAPSYLVIFDRRDDAKSRPWEEKIYRQEEVLPAGSVTILGC